MKPTDDKCDSFTEKTPGFLIDRWIDRLVGKEPASALRKFQDPRQTNEASDSYYAKLTGSLMC